MYINMPHVAQGNAAAVVVVTAQHARVEVGATSYYHATFHKLFCCCCCCCLACCDWWCVIEWCVIMRADGDYFSGVLGVSVIFFLLYAILLFNIYTKNIAEKNDVNL